MAFRIVQMINVQGAVFKLAHCLSRRAWSERETACLQKLCCVSGCHGSALYVLSPPSSLSFPSSLPSPSFSSLLPPSLLSCRRLWMWWWTSSSTTLRNSGRPFGIQHRHLVTEAPPYPTGQMTLTGRAEASALKKATTYIYIKCLS